MMSITRLATRTEESTAVPYSQLLENDQNESTNSQQKSQQGGRRSGIMRGLALIRIQMLGIMDHRDVALRAVSAACKLVTKGPQKPEWNEFRMHVVSAVGEAFNNIALH